MDRRITLALGALVVVVIGALIWRGGATTAANKETTSRDAGAPSASAAELRPTLDDNLFARLTLDGGAGIDPSPAAPLPSGTPKAVRFGVILVQYRGAEGAPGTARSKEEASGLARTLAESAKSDFKGTIAKGDPGSMDDAGRMPRGVLEPSAEYTLFTLRPGDVSEPVDTPRGFWILRRIE
jgi:hypothetical protein